MTTAHDPPTLPTTLLICVLLILSAKCVYILDFSTRFALTCKCLSLPECGCVNYMFACLPSFSTIHNYRRSAWKFFKSDWYEVRTFCNHFEWLLTHNSRTSRGNMPSHQLTSNIKLGLYLVWLYCGYIRKHLLETFFDQHSHKWHTICIRND